VQAFVQALKERTTQITSEAILYWLHDTGLGFSPRVHWSSCYKDPETPQVLVSSKWSDGAQRLGGLSEEQIPRTSIVRCAYPLRLCKKMQRNAAHIFAY
jgi:hypothetical protein